MRSSRRASPIRATAPAVFGLAIALPCLAVLAAEPAIIKGQRLDGAIPAGYEITDTYLRVNPKGFLLEVDGRGDCSTSFDMDSVSTGGTSDHTVPLPRKTCKTAATTYGLPSVFAVASHQAFLVNAGHRTLLGDITGIGKIQWVKLRGACRIDATTDTASLIVPGAGPFQPPAAAAGPRAPVSAPSADPLDQSMPGPDED